MLAHRSEIELTLAQLRQAQAELDARGISYGPVKLGAMIEIPAAALTVRSFLKYFDFLSIGTNDLIQYTLAIDRADEAVAHLYDPMHPAVLRLVAEVIAACNAAGKEICVCGEMAGDLSMTRLLLGLGLRSFPCTPRRFWPSSRRCCAPMRKSWSPGRSRSWTAKVLPSCSTSRPEVLERRGTRVRVLPAVCLARRPTDKDRVMNYCSEQEIAQAIEPVLEDAELARQLAAQSRPAVWLQTQLVEGEDEIPLGATKLGGCPDLPAQTRWPERGPYPDTHQRVESHRADSVAPNSRWRWAKPEQAQKFRAEALQHVERLLNPFPLHFLAQINFADVWAAGPVDEDMPRSGLLSLFYDLGAALGLRPGGRLFAEGAVA